MVTRRTFIASLTALGAGLAALPHLAQRVFGYRQKFVYTVSDRYGQLIARTGPIEFVDVHLTRRGALNSRVQLALENQWGVELKGRSDALDAHFIPESGIWVRFAFSTPPVIHSNYRRAPAHYDTAHWFLGTDTHTGRTAYIPGDDVRQGGPWHEVTLIFKADGTNQTRIHGYREFLVEPVGDYERIV